jgi:hypothetical protein
MMIFIFAVSQGLVSGMKQKGFGKISSLTQENREGSRLHKGYSVNRQRDQGWVPTRRDEIDMECDFIPAFNARSSSLLYSSMMKFSRGAAGPGPYPTLWQQSR